MRTSRFHFFNVFLIQLLIIFISGCTDSQVAQSAQSPSKIYSRFELEQQGRTLAESGRLDQALHCYQEAIKPENIIYEHEKSTAIGAMTEIYKWKGEYDNALKTYQWFFRGGKSNKSSLTEKREIEVLIDYQKNHDSKVITDFIETLKKENADRLPPTAYYSTGTDIIISDILRLYDTIGDYDGGIVYVDSILNYAFSQNPKIERFISSKMAEDYMNQLNAQKKRADGYAYKILREYLLIREAFEQDKAEGKKGSMKEGKLGRATLALIKSDYFPW